MEQVAVNRISYYAGDRVTLTHDITLHLPPTWTEEDVVNARAECITLAIKRVNELFDNIDFIQEERT